MKSWYLLILLLVASAAVADVYKWVDADGVVHFTDQALEGSERVQLRQPTVYSPPPLPRPEKAEKRAPAPAASPKIETYTSFSIEQPAEDETVIDNSGVVAVGLMLIPPLQEGHAITLEVDGKAVAGKFTSTQFTIDRLVRGTHTLKAAIVGGDGTVVTAAAPVRFHLRRASTQLRKEPRPAGDEGESEPSASSPGPANYSPDFRPRYGIAPQGDS